MIIASGSSARALKMKLLLGVSEAMKEMKITKVRRGRSASANYPIRDRRGRRLEYDHI